MMKKFLWLLLILLVVSGVTYGVQTAEPLPDFSTYDYRDTRRLLTLVHKAGALIEEKGEAAFKEFSEDDVWRLDTAYLYVYEENGNNLFHGGYKELRGRNLYDFRDLHGKMTLRMLMTEAQNPNNPHGWVHYLWNPPGSLDPVWKSSCNKMVTMPDGKRVFVGSGLDKSRHEREFFRILVDDAAALIEALGEDAIPVIKAPESKFTILDTRVFVMHTDGSCLLSPGMDMVVTESLCDYVDFTGHKPLQELVRRLESKDSAWVGTLTPGNVGEHPNKMAVYGRNANMGGKRVIVAAISELPRPAWMN